MFIIISSIWSPFSLCHSDLNDGRPSDLAGCCCGCKLRLLLLLQAALLLLLQAAFAAAAVELHVSILNPVTTMCCYNITISSAISQVILLQCSHRCYCCRLLLLLPLTLSRPSHSLPVPPAATAACQRAAVLWSPARR